MATIHILGWFAKGLRCPDHEFSFERPDGTVRPVALIQMPNGTGKTTTLTLIRAALSGDGADGNWENDKVRALAKKGNESGEGEFRIALAVDGRRFTIAMRFDFSEGTLTFTTTGKSGMQPGFNPPAEARAFLTKGFVPFFVFDGELAERLLDREFTNAQEAIEGLFRLDLFETISGRIHGFWEQKVEERGALDNKGLTQRKNRLIRLKQRNDFLTAEKTTIEGELRSKKDTLRRKRASFQAAIKAKAEFKGKLERADHAVEAAKTRMGSCSSAAYSSIRDPHAVSASIAQELVTFKQSLDRVKLPESTAREFFEELAEEDKCVCGRCLDDETRKAIRVRAKDYLGSEDVSLLNSIKSDISGKVGSDSGRDASALRRQIDQLVEAMRVLGEKELERDQVRQEAIDADPALELVEQEISQLDSEVNRLEAEAEKFDSLADNGLSDEQVWGLKVIERRIKDAERKYAEVTETMQLKGKRDVLARILQSAAQNARSAMSAEIRDESNKRILKLLPENQISVARIDRSLHLEGQAGGSVGETLSVAYAFLSTLFSRSGNRMPFIVDSPANPIDLAVRAKVAELVPHLAHQFIAFTISSERAGFIHPLEKAATDIQYITMYRKSGSGGEPELPKGAQATTTADGVIVADRQFFHAYHVDAEEKNGR